MIEITKLSKSYNIGKPNEQLGIVALLYLIILLAVFFPLIRKYSKKTPKELKTSYGIG